MSNKELIPNNIYRLGSEYLKNSEGFAKHLLSIVKALPKYVKIAIATMLLLYLLFILIEWLYWKPVIDELSSVDKDFWKFLYDLME